LIFSRRRRRHITSDGFRRRGVACDGDARGAWLLLDLDARRADFRRAGYDIERTHREIREAGLPEALAVRLATGQ
jgi:hypothetical protein